ncbi:MAG: SiaB family protein kinase [Bacteroidales bacterium]|nr:SiaB family protein kinase [Bacteroidales bacterium]
MKADIHSLYEKSKKGDLVATHEGDINSDLITKYLSGVESSLSEAGELTKITRKVYNILVEALQNLFHHLEIPPKEYLDSVNLPETCRYAFCTLIREGKGAYKVTCGNFVSNKYIQFLRDRIEQLNYLSSVELKELYKRILNNDEFSSKGGGGLGFIEMARMSGQKLGYDFLKYDDCYSFFVLEIRIG